jgi:hypothetical protein
MKAIGNFIGFVALCVMAGLIASFTMYGLQAFIEDRHNKSAEPPIAGPFRPRPRPPEPTPDPLPEPDLADLDARDRRLFERVRKFHEERESVREARQDSRTDRKIEGAFLGLADDLESFDPAKPQQIQGPFGGAIVSALWEFAKKAAKYVLQIAIIGVLGALIVMYWYIVAPAALFLFIGLPAWSARTFGKK